MSEVDRATVLAGIRAEVVRQVALWGEQNHPNGTSSDPYGGRADTWKRINARRVTEDRLTWDGILLEEVCEALAERDPVKLYTELTQVAAVAATWMECLRRNNPEVKFDG